MPIWLNRAIGIHTLLLINGLLAVLIYAENKGYCEGINNWESNKAQIIAAEVSDKNTENHYGLKIRYVFKSSDSLKESSRTWCYPSYSSSKKYMQAISDSLSLKSSINILVDPITGKSVIFDNTFSLLAYVGVILGYLVFSVMGVLMILLKIHF
jgi:hypothetical protein